MAIVPSSTCTTTRLKPFERFRYWDYGVEVNPSSSFPHLIEENHLSFPPSTRDRIHTVMVLQANGREGKNPFTRLSKDLLFVMFRFLVEDVTQT